MKVKIKKLHPNGIIPSYAKDGDAGMDLVAISKRFDENGCVVYGTGLAFEIPKGYVGLIFPRSSVSKCSISMANCVGVVDSGYRGEVTVKFRPMDSFEYGLTKESRKNYKFCYEVLERVAQLIIMPYPHIDFVEVEELSETERADGGFGSTGK